MSKLLQQGIEHEITSTTENTIQSFNGALGAPYGDFFVNIVLDNAVITTDPAQITVTNPDNVFTINIAGRSGSTKFEVGDPIQLHVNGTTNSDHEAQIVSVTHNAPNAGDVQLNSYYYRSSRR